MIALNVRHRRNKKMKKYLLAAVAALALGGLAFSVGASQPGLSGWFARPEAVRAWLGELAR